MTLELLLLPNQHQGEAYFLLIKLLLDFNEREVLRLLFRHLQSRDQ